MRSAIYARKSGTQNELEEDQKSVNRQIIGARAFIAKQEGWTLLEEHVFKDEKSGVLFAGRKDFRRMMAAAEERAFEHLVLFDLDRFGRHGHKTMVVLNELADLGVSVWDFSTGVRVDLDSFEGRITTSLKAKFAQQYRDAVRKHTRASMKVKAEQGFVTGGKTFGYDNVPITKGQTRRVINPEEAAIVREIYERAAAGEGTRTIAEALNRVKAPSPRAQLGRWSAWSSTTIREVLKRPLYRGEVIWGKTMSRYGRELGAARKKGQEMAQVSQPEADWIVLPPDESLRIVSDDLASRVDAIHKDRRTRYFAAKARNGTRVPERSHGKYLLTGGMITCPTCGGNFEAIKYPEPAYVCATRRRKPLSCPNYLTLPMQYADDAVLTMCEGSLLGTKFIEELLAMVDQGQVEDTSRLAAERERLRGVVAPLEN